MNEELLKVISRFKRTKILVIGDVMLDMYYQGKTSRISREAPVPIVDVETVIKAAGGAANTAVNVSSLSGKVKLLSIVGTDSGGKELLNILKIAQVDTDQVIVKKKRQTITKKRVVSSGQMLVRFDSGTINDVDNNTYLQINKKLEKLYEWADAVVISDYGYGVLGEMVIEKISELIDKDPKVVVVDSKYLELYKKLKVTVIKPNYLETLSLVGVSKKFENGRRINQVTSFKNQLLEMFNAKAIAVTLDTDGSLLIQDNKEIYRTFTKPVPNSKAAGAGDTYSSALITALAAGADINSGVELAAAAASVVVQKNGTAVCSKNELFSYFSTSDKYIGNSDEFTKIIKNNLNNDKNIVFTNGCFDILHSGHIDYLNKAKSLGGLLVVGLNSDASIKKLKGNERPVNSLKERIRILSGLSSVDYILSFSEDTPINLIEKIRPDIYVKGGDYKISDLPEANVVTKLGGQVQILPYIKDRSTTKIINKIKKNGRVNSNNLNYVQYI
jgi:D-beta-D-heptose 7-phosphate kinase/D-beta-D-heptose 1-phosphate adenosyltransferase